MDSILNSIKQALGILPEYQYFDGIIITHINSVFSILTQIGVGPDKGFSIKDASTEWSEYILNDEVLNMVRSYMCEKVSLMFDPPLTSSVIEAKKNTIAELEWRLNVEVDPKKEDK